MGYHEVRSILFRTFFGTNMKQAINIAVYCSAADNLKAEWQEAAARLGAWIGRTRATLIYGGVDAGLMRIVAQAVKQSGGKVVGVVPQLRKTMASTLNDSQIEVDGLDQRKAVMQQMADIFVALPGGYGTLDELMSAFAYINFNKITNKSVIICNFDGIYGNLLVQFEKMVSCGLMNASMISRLEVANNVEQLIETLEKQ